MPTKKTVGLKKPTWKVAEVPLMQLHLDPENYRHEPVEGEAEAIVQLLADEKVHSLARDIVEQGATSPLDRIGAVPMPGNPKHLVVVEGNRRVCALHLLNDPERAATQADRKYFRELASKFTVPARIEVVVFAAKAAAKHWVDLRHLGPQEGQGLKSWNAVQKDRAAGDKGSNTLAVAVLDRAVEGGWLSSGAAPAVTTLTRYLKNREVRAALGLGHHKLLQFTHQPEEVDAALKQFLLDAQPRADGLTPLVHSRSKDAERAKYARELRTRGVAPNTALPQPIEPGAPRPLKATGKKSKRDPFKATYLVPPGFLLNNEDPNLRALFAEMKITPIDRHEFATSYLLRAFVERVMTLYLKKKEPGFNASDDLALVNRCNKWLDPETRRPGNLKALRTAGSNVDCAWGLHTLGSAVHLGLMLDRRALIAAWRNWETALRLTGR